MDVINIHDFTATSEIEFINLQNKLREKITLENSFNIEVLNLIAGVDLAYWEDKGRQYATCCIVIIDYKTHEVIEKVNSVGEINTPYIPGFLAFRELPLVIETVSKIQCKPDLFIFDGNGFLHSNNMGLATHASFFLNKPTIGIAKNYFKIDGVEFIMPENNQCSYTDIVVNGKIYGRTIRTKRNAKPVFISCGNNIDLETCTDIALSLTIKESKVPLPTRLADVETHLVRKCYVEGISF